jgi:hypothetical protein
MKKPKIYQLSLPAYSLEKALKFVNFRREVGYSAYECSFLIGKHDYFVRDIENLLDKSSFSTIDTNYILLIFRKEFQQVFPIKTFDGNFTIALKQSIGEKRKSVYEIVIDAFPPTNRSKIIYEEEKHVELPTKLELSDEETLKEFVRRLYDEGFFNNTRTALDIFNECRKDENFGSNFHPRHMIRALNHYTNSKSGEPILDKSRTNLFARRLFFKPINFEIVPSKGNVSKSFRNIGIENFQQATDWVEELPYQRNKNKNNELAILDELCGTCSTKHALLKRLADENGNTELRLMLGIFTMNAKNTPAVKTILKKYNLEYIPEAHNYLRAYNYILDYTGIGVNETKFELDILIETEINPDQITDFKVRYHRDYLDLWIKENQISYSLDEIWRIREECIAAIGHQT